MIYFLLVLLLASSANSAGATNIELGFDKLLDMTVSFLIGQHSEDFSLTPKYYETFLMKDETNENINTLTPQEIIERSGYKYENHYVIADDGYITCLIRIVNPLVDRSQLRQPPVMMFHGGLIDYTVWVWSSAIQHHPEKYPRVAEDGPFTSWNKSLGFVLANHGYDVWLVGTRGSNIFNKGHMKISDHHSWFDSIDIARLRRRKEQRHKSKLANHDYSDDDHDEVPDSQFKMNFAQNLRYWNYTMDDLVKHEVPRQLEKVLQVTGSEKVNIVGLSLSTQMELAIMAENPEFTSRIHNYVSIAPILNNRGTNLFIKLFHTTLCTKTPYPIGTILQQVALSVATRKFTSIINSFRQLRYIIVKQLARILSGPSAKFETNLDSGVWGHILESTGFKHTTQYCQQCNAGQIQKYDYGLMENMRIYGSPKPPKYDLSKIDMPNWLLVSAGNDKAATVSSVKQLLRSVNRKPHKHIHIKRYNHLDLIAGFENDLFVNLPIVEFLNEFALPPTGQLVEQNQIADLSTSARALEAKAIVESAFNQKSVA